jgi:predicted amidohydrolase YtcJ
MKYKIVVVVSAGVIAMGLFAGLQRLLYAAAPLVAANVAIVNANIITVDAKRPRAEAVAFRDGRILLVGTSAEVRTVVGPETKVIDARGRTVTPGFTDPHLHPEMLYPFESPNHVVDLYELKSVDEITAVLRKKAEITPKGQWIRGKRYQDTKIGRHLNRFDLDKISTEHPIHVSHSSGHVSVVNSYVLNSGQITSATKDPPGSGFDRDKNGEPTGLLFEGAAAAIAMRNIPRTPPPSRREQLVGLQNQIRAFLSRGLTAVGDAATEPNKMLLYQEARADWQPIRINMMVRNGDAQIARDLHTAGLTGGFGDDRLRIGPVKLFHGNSLSGRTCWLSQPYVSRPDGRSDYYGIPPARSQEDLDKLVYEIHELGFQPAIHSNGDREIEMVLNAYEKALARLPKKDARFRIEHCSVVNPSILKRIKDLGVIPVFHLYIVEHGDKLDEYGPQRWNMMWPVKTALAMGIHVADSSDSSVSKADPLLKIQGMVTRRSAQGKVYGDQQGVSVEEAIRIWTLGNAYASFDEKVRGSLEVGKLADCVILAADPMKVPPETIKDIQVDMTIIGGKVEYERGAGSSPAGSFK